MKAEPRLRSGPYTTGEHRIVNGRPHGFLWRHKWTVEIDFSSEEEAKTFLGKIAKDGLLPEHADGPVFDGPVVINRRR